MKNEIKSYDSFNKFCTSLQVAKKLGREHRDILTSIRKLICSDELCDNNFIASYYTAHNNKKQPIKKLQKEDIRLLYRGVDYQERKYALAVKALPGKLS